MRAYDSLPPALRGWLSRAALPWSARSALRAFNRALARHDGDVQAALARLDQLEASTLLRDAPPTWGPLHPAAIPAPPGRPPHAPFT